MLMTSAMPSTCPTAMELNSTSITTAKRSSRISTASTTWAKRFWRRPRSVRALRMMVVEDMETMPPRKMQLMASKCRSLPTPNPAKDIPTMMTSAGMTASLPARTSLRKLNSRPRVNMSTIMPSSAQKSMLASVTTDGSQVTLGLARKPARM